MMLLINSTEAGGMAQWIRALAALLGPGFLFQPPHDGSQPTSITPVLGDTRAPGIQAHGA